MGIVGVFVKVCPHSLQGSCDTATNFLAQNNGLVIYYHQYYQLFTSIFVTYSPLDAAFNAIAVLVLVWITEDVMNKTKYFTVFIASALVGNVLTLIQGPYYSSAGASGGIFGIYAALITFTALKEKKVQMPALVLFIVIFVGSSILGPVNYVAHIGGAFGGFICGILLYKSLKKSISEYSMSYDSKPSTILVTGITILLMLIGSIAQFFFFAG